MHCWRPRWWRPAEPGPDHAPTAMASATTHRPRALRLAARRRGLAAALLVAATCAAAGESALPMQLHDTGLFAPGDPARRGPGVQPFAPQHVLWSDGTRKRRWIRLPPGTAIDARDPDAWRFPRGTRLWKEFAYGSRIETRYLVLGTDGRWRFASYVWAADGRSAQRAPAEGRVLAVEDAPSGRYAIPSHDDCLTCHGGARSPVLGVGALQLGPALPQWIDSGLIRHAPAAWRRQPPAMPGRSAAERAARGYLHANCGHCHHAAGGVPVPLVLAQDVAGSPAPSLPQLHEALRRMGTRQPLRQMPPLGTRLTDPEGQALLRAWLDDIDRRSATPIPKESPP